ncbi:MAG: site-specific integrase, partial [Oscillospiraceae bacterium]
MNILEMENGDLQRLVFALTQENAILKFKINQFTVSQVNFGDYICEWLEKHRYKWQETTYKGYHRVIHNHIAPYFREKKITLQSLKPSVIEEYYNFKTQEGLGGNTIKRHHANIRKCLKAAEKDEIINKNPALLADLPLQSQTTIDYYNKGALLILLKATRSTNLYPLILLAILGLRRSEILGVRWSRINCEAATLTVAAKVVPLNGQS